MSQYISAFLIDPVVRQARRFSRPNHDSGPTFHPDDVTEYLPRDALARVATAAHEEPSNVRLSIHNVPENISDAPQVDTPTSLEDVDDRGQQLWQRGHSSSAPLRAVEREDIDLANDVRRHTIPNADDTSSNPLYGVPGSFRSTTSSLSSAAQSIFDGNMSPADGPAASSIIPGQDARGRGGSQSSRMGDGSLPADDGMGHMRKRIIAIQRTDSSNEFKARLVHSLMTEKHNPSQQNLHQMARPHSPVSIQSSDRPVTPSSPRSMESLQPALSPPTTSSSTVDPAHPFQVSPEDLRPTYYEKPRPPKKEAGNSADNSERTSMELEEEEPKALGCAHYKRNIKLQCSACHRWYTCRFCHDAVEDHMLNRRETKNMLCMLCGCAQPASEECALCSERGAWYYCDVCKLWDDDPQKSIYHCNDCGICRVGQGLGKDFFHCKVFSSHGKRDHSSYTDCCLETCCVCMAISIRDTHRCIERSTDCDCPICGEYMFTSPQTVVFMKCGHSIHLGCYNEHMKSSYRCPICSRSMCNMEWQFIRLERAIEAQPMPPEFQDTKAWVYCNDCSAKTAVKYHWLGLKCGVCDSYNTAQLQILSGPAAVDPPPPPTSEDSRTHLAPTISRPDSRSRSRYHQNRQSRSGTSAPPTVSARHSHDDHSRRRSLPPNPTVPFPPNGSPASESDAEDFMDTDTESYEEVEFWGGEDSPPRARHNSPPPQMSTEMAIDESSEEDEDDSEDQEMSDEEDEPDGMEIFGHR